MMMSWTGRLKRVEMCSTVHRGLLAGAWFCAPGFNRLCLFGSSLIVITVMTSGGLQLNKHRQTSSSSRSSSCQSFNPAGNMKTLSELIQQNWVFFLWQRCKFPFFNICIYTVHLYYLGTYFLSFVWKRCQNTPETGQHRVSCWCPIF